MNKKRPGALVPMILNVRQLPGFGERQPVIPAGAIYIGRVNARYRLPPSKWANPFAVKREADRETAIASYERWLRSEPRLMDAAAASQLPRLRGQRDVDYVLGLPGNAVLSRLVETVADDVRGCRAEA